MTAQALIRHPVLGLEGLAVKPCQAQSNVVNVYLFPDLGSPRTLLKIEERRPRLGGTPRLSSISRSSQEAPILLLGNQGQARKGQMVFWDGIIPGHIFTIEIFRWEGRISSSHIVSTLHLNGMKWKEGVGVFTLYATFLA